jgi:cell division GTPase FtsZ
MRTIGLSLPVDVVLKSSWENPLTAHETGTSSPDRPLVIGLGTSGRRVIEGLQGDRQLSMQLLTVDVDRRDGEAHSDIRTRLDASIEDAPLVLMALSLGDHASVQLAAALASQARSQGSIVFVWAHHPLYSSRLRIEAPAAHSLQLLEQTAHVLLELAEDNAWREAPSALSNPADPWRASVVAGIVWSIEDICRLVARFPMSDALTEIQTLFPHMHSRSRSSTAYRGRIGLGWAGSGENTQKALERAICSPFLGSTRLSESQQVLVIISGGEGRGDDLAQQIGAGIMDHCPAGVDVLYGTVPTSEPGAKLGITILATTDQNTADLTPRGQLEQSSVLRLRRTHGATALEASEPSDGTSRSQIGGDVLAFTDPRNRPQKSLDDG